MRRISKLLILINLFITAIAQVPVTPIVQPHMTFVNSAGTACVGCLLYSYAAGSTTPQATYTDSTGTSQNTNPIILGADGGPLTPGGSSGAIWLGTSAYKLVLIDTLGSTIWSADNVTAGTLFPCGTASAIQIANSATTGLTCDPNITINTTSHTINVGTLPTGHITIGALGTPTSWTFDTTSPATALASLDGVPYPPAGIPNSTGSAWAASYGVSGTGSVALTTSPVFVTPTLGAASATSVQIASGSTLSDNQGNGAKVQHSTGTTTTGDGVKFDANGNVVDAGSPYPSGTSRTCNASGCYRVESDGTIEQWGTHFCASTSCGIVFPTTFTTTANLSFTATINYSAGNVTTVGSSVTTSGATATSNGVVDTGGGGSAYTGGGTYHWFAIGN